MSSRTDANTSRVFDFFTEQPKSTVKYIADTLQLSDSTVHRILVDELLFRKVCSVWVPHTLTDDNRQQRVACCQGLLQLYDDYSEYELLRLWATQDESWIPFESVGNKEDNKACLPIVTPRPVVVRPQLTAMKTMLSIAFTGNGKVFADVTERGETIDSERYVNFVRNTGEHWRTLRSDPTCLRELLWQHDNARPHTSATSKAFFVKREVQLVSQSPYSPDLNQCDRWLFKKLKHRLRHEKLTCAQDVLKATLEIFRGIPQDSSQSCESFRNIAIPLSPCMETT